MDFSIPSCVSEPISPSARAAEQDGNLTLISVLLNPVSSSEVRYDYVKRILDLVAGLLLLVVAFPVIAIGWLLVRATSPGSGIYTQTRVGLGGRHFRIYKLRTMGYNCEATTGGAKWSTYGDVRITPIGRIFRKLHIDELPQLWNVILGDMSLVGPRPERPEFVTPLSVSIPDYTLRLAVRPGVTGLAQIQLLPDTDLNSVRKKVAMDRCYIDNRGPWLDLRLIVGTAIYLVGFSYGRVSQLLALPRPRGAASREPSRMEPVTFSIAHEKASSSAPSAESLSAITRTMNP